MKICFLVIDGMNDLPIKQLSNKTPLEVAKTETIDFLASKGSYGLIKLFDFAPESDEAMMALLDLNPEKNFPGRGILEAYGAGLALERNAIYFRCNVVKVKGKRILDFQAKISDKLKKKIEKLINSIDLGINFKFKFTKGHRAVLIFKGKNFSDAVSNTNPVYVIERNKLSKALPRPKSKFYFIKKAIALKKTKNAIFTAKKLNEFTEKVLELLKKYNLAIVVRGASKHGRWFNELKKYKKYREWALISEMPVEIAIGKLVGMKIYNYEQSYIKLVKKVLNLLRKHNVYLQIKGPDAHGHRGDYRGKIKSIEKIDRKFLRPLIKGLLGKNIQLIITCDHITSSKHLSHYKGPVTFLKVNLRNIKKIEKTKINFSEKLCRSRKIIKPKFLLKL